MSSHSIGVLLPYPNPNDLQFESEKDGLSVQKPVTYKANERTVPIRIAPHQSYTSVYYINRYLAFVKPGVATIHYRLTLPLSTGNDQERWVDRKFKGTFRVATRAGSENEIQARFAQY